MKIPEILSPVGDLECLKAAIQNGADSVYLGASSFNARAKATNFDEAGLIEAIKYAKLRNVKVNLTLNTLIKNDEFEEAVKLAVHAYNIGVDGIIIQDLGFAKYLLNNYPQICVHSSTQMTVHNLEGVKQLENLGFSRVVLSRELSIDEIKYIRENSTIELEVFVHGALCISYSGQCLFSSMIGGRSGNRGLCAQPCRLPYELYDEKQNKLDNGYLLSPRDLCSIELLPELIKSGVDSFKIEGRMKTPEYVGIVTQIYKKYVNLVIKNIELDNLDLREIINKELNKIDKNIGLTDKEKLTQVFNRGGFSSGHLSSKENKNLIFKEKPNNMGIYLGDVFHFNSNKGHIKLKLENTISIGDKVSINSDLYNVSELMIGNKNFDSLGKGNIVTIGRMKGKISTGDKIYKIANAKLSNSIAPTYKEDKNFKKIPINGEIIIKKNTPISLRIWSNEGFYDGLEYIATSTVSPEIAINKPINKDKIMEQLCKTGNTEFEFKNINITLDDNLFIPKISILNDIRRTALTGLEELVIKENTHNISYSYNYNHKQITTSSKNSISLLLNIIDKNTNYLKLENINKLYIPLKYWLNPSYSSNITKLAEKFNTYIYMPNIIKDKISSKSYNTEISKIVKSYNIKGFVVSHISQLETLQKYNLELIGNYNLNIYNSDSINELKQLEINTFTMSPELDKFEIKDLINSSCLESELIVYGKTPVMTNNYCYLGKSNKCYNECTKKCMSNDLFYLKDRLGFSFRIVPDELSAITTIYNSKITSIKYSDFEVNNIRIDILDENLDEIRNIINTVKSGDRFEGKEYTNGRI